MPIRAWFVSIGACLLLLGCPQVDDEFQPSTDDDDDLADDDDTPTDDLDGDGWTSEEGDCDDNDDSIHPGATEIQCDGTDNDCDPTPEDDSDTDQDGDGYSVCEDCDDSDPSIHPGAEEICNSIDDDCDGEGLYEEVDGDGDGYAPCEDDCDDLDPEVYPGSPDVIDVPADFATIQWGIDAATDGQVVCVGPGTYAERIDFGGKRIRVIGMDGADDTVIDGSSFDRSVVQFVTGETPDTALSRFTIAHGYAESGGGILIENASPTLRDLVLLRNEAIVHGGGLRGHSADPILERITFLENTADQGGGAYFQDGVPSLDQVVFQGNEASDGGAAYWRGSSPNLSNVLAQGNTASQNSGGLHFWLSGGRMTNALVIDNEAQHHGGGLTLRSSSTQLDNVLLVGNVAEYGGGAMMRGDHATVTGDDATLINVTIAGNTADYGSGLFFWADSKAGLTNVIVAQNSSENPDSAGLSSSNSDPILEYCDVWGNTPQDVHGITFTPGVDGNLSEDPMFLSMSGTYPLDWDLHLSPASLVVDAGESSISDPDGGLSDMGAYGGSWALVFDLDWDDHAGWWRPGPYDATTSPDLDCDDLDPAIHPGNGC